MKLEQLRTLQRELVVQLNPDGIQCLVHYLFDGKWYDVEKKVPVDEHTEIQLEKSRQDPIAHHAASSLTAWFYVKTAECTVSLTFTKSPQISTRKKYRTRIAQLYEAATNAYKVSHNALTHLLAKDAFRQKLTLELEALGAEAPISADAQESQVPRLLAVMALDIDFFKQVNDTWGHLYGDQVLKTFGRRLEMAAEKIRLGSTEKPSIHLGHPSGEEFLIVVSANAPREFFVRWANEFRTKIADEVLPTEKEWQWLIESDNLSDITPPAIPERTLTTSIGVVLHTGTATAGSAPSSSVALLDRADTALYRAKAAGRNQVIFFDEILSSCGRTLEQDQNTGVVALDIGSNVGVTIGQEFKVFLPLFTGKRKFSVNDGRTTRTLGLYPRVESTRIVVFNAQPELSFAFISNPDDARLPIEPGSNLEAIPAGSIGHLLPNASKYFPAAIDSLPDRSVESVQAFIREVASTNSGPFAIVIRFNHEAEYVRKFGTAALNIALAKLYRFARNTFHAARMIEVLDQASICIAGARAAYKEQIVTDFADSTAADLPELGILIGVFCEADQEAKLKPGEEKLDAAHAIEFARFAASEHGRSPESRIRHFNYATVRGVLQALRDARSFEIAYADFDRLRRLGVDSPSLRNLGGLLAGAQGLMKEALQHYEAAVKADPKGLIYKSNFGTVAYRLGEVDVALKLLNSVPLKEIDQLLNVHPFGYVTYARLLAQAKLNQSSQFDETRFAHVAQAALDLTPYQEASDNQYIRDAIALG